MPRNSVKVISVVLACFLFLASTSIYASEVFELKSGTIVRVQTTSAIDPKTVRVGDQVTLYVVGDIKVRDKVVISNGTAVAASISDAKDAGMVGTAGKIGITISSCQAVDGTFIALSGQKLVAGDDSTAKSAGLSLLICPLFLLMEGEKAVIPAGTIIEARVAGNFDIEVE